MDPKKYPRVGGLILFGIGASTATWFYQNTIDRAATHESMAIALPYAFMAMVSFSCIGLGLLIFGERMQAYSSGLKNRNKDAMDFLIIGLFLLPGIVAFYLLQQQLRQFGYQ
jgi:hypothetical protein